MEQFTNRNAIMLWVTAPAVLVVMAYGTYRYVTEVPDKSSALIIGMMALLWLGTLWFCYVALSTGITHVQVERDRGVTIVRRYPHKTVSRLLTSDQVNRAEVIEVRDMESGDVFIARVKVADGDEFNLVTTNSRDACEDVCWRFNITLFGSRG